MGSQIPYMEFEKDPQKLRSGSYIGQNDHHKFKKRINFTLKTNYNHRFCAFDTKIGLN